MILPFPPTRWVTGPLKGGANARVNLFGIRLKRGIARSAAVFAQELYEWSVRVLIFAGVLLIAIGAAILAGQLVLLPIGLLAAYAACELPFVGGPGMRWLELRGHAVTIAATQAHYLKSIDSIDAYRRAHARSMQTFYSAFRDMTVDEIDARLFNLHGWAGRWIDKPFARGRIDRVKGSADGQR